MTEMHLAKEKNPNAIFQLVMTFKAIKVKRKNLTPLQVFSHCKSEKQKYSNSLLENVANQH